MPLATTDFEELAETLVRQDPREILAYALGEYSPRIAISFSGAEDVVLVDMAAKLGGKFRVFSLDTGRLHPETYRFLDKVREHYGIPIEVFFPKPAAVEKLVREKACFRSTATGTRSAAAFARSSRSGGRLGISMPG